MVFLRNNRLGLNEKNPLEDFVGICEDVKLGREPRMQYPIRSDFPTSEGIFYRGEPEIFTESLLIPKIFRKEHLDVEEAELISDFKATFPEHEKSLSSNIDWLSFMQHQGLPTRLLDWSTDPLVALYFAIGQDNYDLEEDGVVYIFPIVNRIRFPGSKDSGDSPIRLTAPYYSTIYSKLAEAGLMHEIKGLKKQIIPKYPDAVEVFPPNSHARIKAQSGVFTIHYGKYLNRQKILGDELDHRKSYFVTESFKIIIPKKVKPYLKKKLEVLGKTEFKLFPEEAKFCNHFRKKKFHEPLRMLTGKAKEMMKPVADPQQIREILLNIDNPALNPGITEVLIPDIVKQFKLLGIEKVIDEIVKKFFCSFIKFNNTFIFSHLYSALEEFCKENKGNQKLVLQQLAKLEQETKLLSKITEIFNQNSRFDSVFESQSHDDLFYKAIKFCEKKKTTSQQDSVESNPKNPETTSEKN